MPEGHLQFLEGDEFEASAVVQLMIQHRLFNCLHRRLVRKVRHFWNLGGKKGHSDNMSCTNQKESNHGINFGKKRTPLAYSLHAILKLYQIAFGAQMTDEVSCKLIREVISVTPGKYPSHMQHDRRQSQTGRAEVHQKLWKLIEHNHRLPAPAISNPVCTSTWWNYIALSQNGASRRPAVSGAGRWPPRSEK